MGMTMSGTKTVSILTGFERIFNCILNDEGQSEPIRELCIRALEDTSELIDIIISGDAKKVKYTPPNKPLPEIPGIYNQAEHAAIRNLMDTRRESLRIQEQSLDTGKPIFKKEKTEKKETFSDYIPDEHDAIRDMISARKSNVEEKIPQINNEATTLKNPKDKKEEMAPTINKLSRFSVGELNKVTRDLFKESTKFIMEINPNLDVDSAEFSLLVNNEMDQRFSSWELA